MKKAMMLMLCSIGIVGCSANYSEGYRVGIVRKFSKKGVFIKSWEGELLLGGVVQQGSGQNATLVNETFEFSVDPDDTNAEEIAKEISKAMDLGKRTKIHYIQNTIPKIRTSTDYFVQKVEDLDGNGLE